MSVGERIKDRRKELGLSVDYVAKKLGKNRATVYRYESSEIENMPLDIIKPLSEVLRVTPAYLMGWESKDELPDLSSDYPFIPATISAGLPLNVESIKSDDVEQITIPDSLMGKYAGSKDIYFMRVNGESMNNVMPDRSLIAVKSINLSSLKNGDIVVYSDGHDYSVKRFYRDGTRLIFRPDSKDDRFYDYITDINNQELVIHGKVVLYIVELD